jgi:hypothetical protein
MKFVINDYSSANQSESHYLNATFNSIDGCSSVLWDGGQISAFDLFDTVRPDIWITHFKYIVNDGLIYMGQKGNNTELIINITGANQEEVSSLEDFIISKNVRCLFFFTNLDDNTITTKKINIVKVQLGADLFLLNNNRNQLSYNVEKAIFINNKTEIKPYSTTHHIISNNIEATDGADLVLTIAQLGSIYHNYSEIIFRYFDRVVPQLFYDATYAGNRVYYDIDNDEKRNYVNQKFKKILKIENNICDPQSLDFEYIKSCVKNKHTCLHRAKSLLSQLPAHEFIKKLEVLIDRSVV